MSDERTKLTIDSPATPVVVVSHHLPVHGKRTENGTFVAAPATGQLMRTVGPVIRRRGGAWIGWHGLPDAVADRELESAPTDFPLGGVSLDSVDVASYSDGFCHGALWPLLHENVGRTSFVREHWHAYCDVNARFADAVRPWAERECVVWVHDYQLIKVGEALRKQGVEQPIQFFLHAPFPGLDVFRRLPWRRQLLWSLLAYDLVGVQTRRDLENLIACLIDLVPEVEILAGNGHYRLRAGERVTALAAVPTGIDWAEFDGYAREREVDDATWLLRDRFDDQRIILGVDRLDYMKGIRERLAAFELFLEQNPGWHERVALHQVAVPARDDVPAYRAHERNIDEMIGYVNGRFSTPAWTPIHYRKARLSHADLVAAYRTADVFLSTTLRDGMDLAAKEFVASSVDDRGVLILSEFAGAVEELGPAGSLVVNPHDVEGVANALLAALEMPAPTMKQSLARLRDVVERADAFAWGDRLLSAARVRARVAERARG